jgi:hypothetical protein
VLAELSAYLAAERAVPQAGPEINRSSHGLRFCGYRIKPGTIRLTRRKQRRYRVLRTHWEAAWERGEIDSPSLQRAYDALLAPTLLADARVWRQHDLRIHPCLYDHGEG